MDFLYATGVCKSFETGEGPLRVLRGVSLSLQAGQSLALTGESGSGKTSLIMLIGGLEQATSGKIFFQDQEITNVPTSGVVCMHYNIDSWKDISLAAELLFFDYPKKLKA